MTFVRDLLSNRVLLSGLFAWMTAQILKAILFAAVNRRFSFSRLVGDGGMPSGHSATVSAVAASCALIYGADSATFALSAILAIITCHDAMNARQAIGKQAAILNKMIKGMLEGERPEAMLEEFIGHTPSQVYAGILLGILVAVLFYLAQ